MRIAPSSLITSPLSISFSTTLLTSCAYSAGRPRRGGKGTIFPRESCDSFPGASRQTGLRSRASTGAIGRVLPPTPPFEADYAACPI